MRAAPHRSCTAVVVAAVALLGAAGCAPPLAVHAVSPATLQAGAAATLTIEGEGFDDATTWALESDGAVVSLGAAATTAARVEAAVPAALPPGTYDVVARRDGIEARLADAVDAIGGLLRIVFLDVDQGDATLVIAPSGEVLLFDGGPPSATAALRAGIDAWAGGRVDVVAISHVDADHLGGVVAWLAGADGVAGTADDVVDAQVLSPSDDGACDSQLCGRMRALASFPFTSPVVGDALALGDVELEVVAIAGDVGGGGAEPGVDEDNERSLVLAIRYAGRSVLVTGDLTGGGLGTASLEAPLAAKTGPVDVLRSAHHGSASSSDPIALAAWQPRAIVSSLGTDNPYCHPAQVVVDRWATTGARLWSTGAGIVNDGDRCDGATSWPVGARVGAGDVLLEIDATGGMRVDGEEL